MFLNKRPGPYGVSFFFIQTIFQIKNYYCKYKPFNVRNSPCFLKAIALNFWEVYPTLRKSLFEKINDKYSNLTIENEQIKNEIYSHPEFESFITQMDSLFNGWKQKNTTVLKALDKGNKPKEVIAKLSEDLLQSYHKKALINKYNVYQLLLSYWNETMQDDCYIVSADGWIAETYRITIEGKGKGKDGKKKMIDKGWTCDLIPKELVIKKYYETEKIELDTLETQKESIASEITELEEEHNTEDGYFGEIEKISKATVTKKYKELQKESDADKEELKVCKQYIDLHTKLSDTNKKIKQAEKELDEKLYAKYPTLTETEVKQLVVDDKWIQTIENAIKGEIDHISQRLTNRIKELAERYATPLPQIDKDLTSLETKVNTHLTKMGFVWN
jgi:type I restriction enzyme M protein